MKMEIKPDFSFVLKGSESTMSRESFRRRIYGNDQQRGEGGGDPTTLVNLTLSPFYGKQTQRCQPLGSLTVNIHRQVSLFHLLNKKCITKSVPLEEPECHLIPLLW